MLKRASGLVSDSLVGPPDDLAAYCDASHDQAGGGAFVVGGWIAPTRQWVRFDEDWEYVLRMPHLQAAFFRHVDYMASQGPFEGWRDREEDRRDLIRRLLLVMGVRCSYGCSAICDQVAAQDYSRRHPKLADAFTPYAVTGLIVAKRFEWWAGRYYPDARLRVVFESGTVDEHQLRRMCAAMDVNPAFAPKVQVRPPEQPAQYIRAFQAADLLAGEHRKEFARARAKQPPRWPLIQLDQRIGAESAEMTTVEAEHFEDVVQDILNVFPDLAS